MAHVEGLENLLKRFAELPTAVAKQIDSTLEVEMKKLQSDAVDLVPVDTGKGKATLALPEAIKKDKSPDTGGSRFTFGFITPAMRKAAFYLFWVEFGTKSYQAGDQRNSGKDKKGRRRKSKVKRFVPARLSQPFFRPAVAMFLRRLDQQRALEKIAAAAKAAVGFH